MKAAACALLSLVLGCSSPPRPAAHDAPVPDGGRAPSAASAAGRTADPTLAADAASRDAGSAGATAALAVAEPAAVHVLRVRAVTGLAQSGDTTLVEGAMLAADAPISLATGARLTLAFDDYVRVELTGPALARALPRGVPALLVREGVLTVDVAARGVHGTESAFWLATPLARVDVADSARLFVRVTARGAGELVVVSGHAQRARPDDPELLAAGSAHCVGPDGLVALSRPFGTLEQATDAFSRGPSCAGRAGAAGPQRERELSAALDAVQQREQSEVSLLAEHTRLVALGDARAQAVRGVLAGSAALLARQRAWATAQHAQLEAWSLGRAPTPSQAVLLERADRLAPYRR